VDVHSLGERAAIGVAQLGGDYTGRFFVGRHRGRQGMAQQVRVGSEPGAGGQAGEGAAGVVGVDRRAPLSAEHQVQLDRTGCLAGLYPAQPEGGDLAEGETEPGLLAAVMAECTHGEGWQGEDGVAGRGLERPDDQFLA
jgi:hypothetical protein